ncbi:hypothetical protein DFH06DRAFT_1136880 [Mycena polygramma]|nr:hypothetical protein DFH06DRAFT_1136880 [Mycena polygramma]
MRFTFGEPSSSTSIHRLAFNVQMAMREGKQMLTRYMLGRHPELSVCGVHWARRHRCRSAICGATERAKLGDNGKIMDGCSRYEQTTKLNHKSCGSIFVDDVHVLHCRGNSTRVKAISRHIYDESCFLGLAKLWKFEPPMAAGGYSVRPRQYYAAPYFVSQRCRDLVERTRAGICTRRILCDIWVPWALEWTVNGKDLGRAGVAKHITR